MDDALPIFIVVTTLLIAFPLAFWVLILFIRRSGAVEAVVALVEKDPDVNLYLGTPLKVGRFVIGQMHLSFFGSGSAFLWIPLKGPRGACRAWATLKKSNGIWRVNYVSMRIGQKKIVLR